MPEVVINENVKFEGSLPEDKFLAEVLKAYISF